MISLKFLFALFQCGAENCRGRTFVPKRSSPMTETIDWQTVRLQEIMSDNQKEAGRIPRTVDCELTRDLGKGTFLWFTIAYLNYENSKS